MIPNLYSEKCTGPLVRIPPSVIRRCEELPDYNITPLAGLLFYIPQLENVKTILEIGTGWCLSTIAFASALDITDGRMLSIDTHNRSNILRNYPDLTPRITQVVADSHNIEQCSNIISVNGFKTFDLIFIDGDHTYEGVKKDFESFVPFLNPDGIVLMHDIALTDPDKGVDSIDVDKFWDELDETAYSKFPIYASSGLGLVRRRK